MRRRFAIWGVVSLISICVAVLSVWPSEMFLAAECTFSSVDGSPGWLKPMLDIEREAPWVARWCYTRLLQSPRHEELARYELGVASLRMGDPSGAIELLRETSRTASRQFYLGVAHDLLGDHRAARQFYEDFATSEGRHQEGPWECDGCHVVDGQRIGPVDPQQSMREAFNVLPQGFRIH